MSVFCLQLVSTAKNMSNNQLLQGSRILISVFKVGIVAAFGKSSNANHEFNMNSEAVIHYKNVKARCSCTLKINV